MTTAAGPSGSWSGPASRSVSLRSVGIGALALVLVVGCLVPFGSRGTHATVVLAGLLVTLGLAVCPRPAPRPRWRIDAAGVTAAATRGTTHVPAAGYDALAFGAEPGTRRNRLQLVRRGSPAVVVHTASLDDVGTPFTACVVARRLGLELLLPPAGLASVAAGEQRLHAALTAAPPAQDGPATTPPETLRDRSGGRRARALTIRLVLGLLGVVLVAALAAPVGETGTGRLGAALGVLLVLAALPRVTRRPAVGSALCWRVAADGLDVTDRDRGRWRGNRADIGAVALTVSERSGHGARPVTSALVVDPSGAPLVELPLRAIDPTRLADALRRHHVPVVHAGVEPWEVREDDLRPPK